MSAAEGPRKFDMEKAALGEAYRDHIKKMFEVFYFATCTASEKNTLHRFKSNLETLRRAYVQAISIFSEHDQI